MITVSVPPGGAVTVVVVAWLTDSVVVGFGGSLIITESVPPGAVTVWLCKIGTNIQWW